jgi:exopolysaccharide biosynthesis WecB/TagA/CpsF family protein
VGAHSAQVDRGSLPALSTKRQSPLNPRDSHWILRWHTPAMPPTIEILDVSFARLDYDGALQAIERLYDNGDPAFIAFANSFSLNLATANPSYKAVLRRADLVLNDGKGVMLAALLHGSRFPADLNGNAMSPRILERAAARGWPVYFLGGRPGVAERAAARLSERMPSLKIVGVQDGYFDPADQHQVIEKIRAGEVGVLMVALGNPHQEFWLDRHLPATGARVGLGVGAFFDFQAGEVERAPEVLNRLGLEWVHRLIKEPRRLWRRYLIGHPLFLARVLYARAKTIFRH